MITKSRHWYSLKKMIPSAMYEPLLDGYYKVRSTAYQGSQVFCPICEHKFQSFINAHACPLCGSGRRHRLLFLYLQRKTDFFNQPKSVLHFAPEHCFYRRFPAFKNLDYTSADLNSPRAMEKVDMTNIQFSDDYFDVVISSHVLEHIPDDLKAMKELFRVMKPGGWSIHQAPIDYARAFTYEDSSIVTNEGRLKHFGHIDHKRIYGRDYPQRLQEAGFTVIQDEFAQQLSQQEIDFMGLDKFETIYLCLKEPILNSSVA